MLVRILHFVLGALAGAGGGYLLWMNRADVGTLFPPGPAGPPWMIVAGALAVAAGVVFLVSAVHPRPNRRRELEAREAKRTAHLGEAEAYYAEAGRAADRDWRSGDIPAPAAPQPVAAPAPAQTAPVTPPPVTPPPAQPAPVAPAPVPPPPIAATPSQPVKPVATAVPTAAPQPAAPQPAVAAPAPASAAFPSAASLAPIPVAAEPPPAIPATPAVAAAVVPSAAADPHAAIRSALKAGQLAEAERLLEAGRESAKGLALAELTGLAGDHAAAAGRQSHAKWLWRLAIKRFGEEGAMDTPAARAISESLRVTG